MSATGAPELIDGDLFLEGRATVPIKSTVAHFPMNGLPLTSFGAPVPVVLFQ